MQKSRHYRFDGGCITYRFDMRISSQALVDEGATAIRTISRAELDTRLTDSHKATAQ